MSPLKRLCIACISYILLGWFICQPLIDFGRYKPYLEMSKNGHEISHKELDEFLNIWSNLMQSRFAGNSNKKSLHMKTGYPSSLKKWLRLQYWDINRFFYGLCASGTVRSCIGYDELDPSTVDYHHC